MQLFPIFQAKYAWSVCPGSLLKKKVNCQILLKRKNKSRDSKEALEQFIMF